MIVVNLKGGLGNQMFQYAFGLALAHKYNTELKVDTRLLSHRPLSKDVAPRTYDLDVFGIPAIQAIPKDFPGIGLGMNNLYLMRLWTRFCAHIPGKPRVVRQKCLSFNRDHMDIGPDAYVDGYWQSEKYFKRIEGAIRDRYVVPMPLVAGATKLLQRIAAEESVCLNVRRGDFANLELHGTFGVDYFERAVGEMARRIGSNFKLFIFSDDKEWCTKNLRFGMKQEIIGSEYAGPKYATKFALMCACKHFIIPNSTFAWWAAWLAKNKGKTVIGPAKWFNNLKVDIGDVLPETWVRV